MLKRGRNSLRSPWFRLVFVASYLVINLWVTADGVEEQNQEENRCLELFNRPHNEATFVDLVNNETGSNHSNLGDLPPLLAGFFNVACAHGNNCTSPPILEAGEFGPLLEFVCCEGLEICPAEDTPTHHPSESPTEFPSESPIVSPPSASPVLFPPSEFPTPMETPAPTAIVSDSVVQTAHLIGFQAVDGEDRDEEFAVDLLGFIHQRTKELLRSGSTRKLQEEGKKPFSIDVFSNINCPTAILDGLNPTVCHYLQSTLNFSDVVNEDPAFCQFLREDLHDSGRLEKEYQQAGTTLSVVYNGSFVHLLDAGVFCPSPPTAAPSGAPSAPTSDPSSDDSDDEGLTTGQTTGIVIASATSVIIVTTCIEINICELIGLGSLFLSFIRFVRRYIMTRFKNYDCYKFTNNTDDKLLLLVCENKEEIIEKEEAGFESSLFEGLLTGALKVERTRTVTTGKAIQEFFLKKKESRDVFVHTNFYVAVLSQTPNHRESGKKGKVLLENGMLHMLRTKEYEFREGELDEEYDFFADDTEGQKKWKDFKRSFSEHIFPTEDDSEQDNQRKSEKNEICDDEQRSSRDTTSVRHHIVVPESAAVAAESTSESSSDSKKVLVNDVEQTHLTSKNEERVNNSSLLPESASGAVESASVTNVAPSRLNSDANQGTSSSDELDKVTGGEPRSIRFAEHVNGDQGEKKRTGCRSRFIASGLADSYHVIDIREGKGRDSEDSGGASIASRSDDSNTDGSIA